MCHTLIKVSLADHYLLWAYPVVQGGGRRLFPNGFAVPELRLPDAKAFRYDITYSCYASN